MLTQEDIKVSTNLIQYGLVLQSLLLMLDYSIQKNKPDVIHKLSEAVELFQKSLSEEEKKEFGTLVDVMIQEKTTAIYENLEKELSKQEFEDFISKIQAEINLTTLSEKLKNFTPLKPELVK